MTELPRHAIVGKGPSEIEPWECGFCADMPRGELCNTHKQRGWTPRNRKERREAARASKRR